MFYNMNGMFMIICIDLAAVFFGIYEAVCSLFFSQKNQSPTQTYWIFTEIRLHYPQLDYLVIRSFVELMFHVEVN